ncbi:MAG: NfeD family protein [Bacteroidaceae bacterium]|nr:NfeD family protein [Bacteroidaceae bacterium]
MSATVFWVILALALACTELLTGTLYILCLAVGALIAIPLAALDVPVAWQVIVFALASVASVYTLRPIAMRYLHHTDKKDSTSNADAVLGREGVVSKDIPEHGFGRLALDGDDWKAQTADGSALAKGKRAKIVDRNSLIVTVEPVTD